MTTVLALYPDSRRRFSCRTKTIIALCSLSTLALFLGISSARAQENKPPVQPAPTTAAQPAPTNAAQPVAGESVVAMEQFVVTGVRGSLINAEEIKLNSPDFVDSIVAQDIGKLPDITVADALQRIPGVQVGRNLGEVSSVVIRGLPNIEDTVNGYEVFTGTGRGVALQDVPAELVSGLDVYKSVGPDKIEGGVAGLIDIRLRRPFDFTGFAVAGTGRGIYETQAKKNSYTLSGLVSNRWKTSAGEFGALFDVSYARTQYMDQVIDNYVHFGALGETFDIATDSSGTQGYYADNFGIQLNPGDRKRAGASVMLQWKPNDKTEFYWDNLYTRYDNKHAVNFFIGIPSWANAGFFIDNVSLYPAGNEGYNVPNNLGNPARFVQSLTAHFTNTLTSKQAFHDTTDTYQGAVGGKWDDGTVKVSGELSYNFSTFRPHGAILDTQTITPSFSISYNDNNASTVNATGIDYTNPANFYLTQLFDQWQRDHSVQYAVRGDVLYRLQNSIVKSLEFGVRYADRDVNSHAANGGGDFQWMRAPATSVPGLGSVYSTEPFISAGQINVRHWWSADENFLLNNTDVIRQIFGHALGAPPADPTKTFTDKEKTTTFYGLANYATKLGEMPLDGVIGVRFSHAQDTLTGLLQQTIANVTTYQLTTVDRSRWETLPTFNGRLKLQDDLLFRYSYTKTVTRPGFSALNPALSLTAPGPTLPGLGSGGNPDLEPIRSTNYDASLEYYPSKSSLASVAVFYRTIEGYIQNYAGPVVVNGNTYSVTRPQSTHNGYLQGAEVAYQYFFDFLPDAFKGLGFQANYTYIKGETENPILKVKQTIAQVSKDNYNIILIYERGPFSSRLAYNWRGKWIDSFNQPGIQPTTVWVQPRGQLDFSAGYAVTKGLTITFDATNITKSKYKDDFGNLSMFPRDVRSYDTTYELGVRCRF